MKIFKGIIAFLLFVFCLGFLAGLSNKNNIDWGSLFPSKETETITDEVNETSASQDTEALTSDLQESTSEPQESMTEVSPDEVDFSKLSMNCLGDSVTAGGCGENNCSYVPELKSILGIGTCRNYSVGGSPISDIRDNSFIDRYTSMDDNADIVFVFGGFNDFSVEIGNADDLSSNTFCGALNTLIIGLQEKYPSAYIFFVAPYRQYNSSSDKMFEGSEIMPSGHAYADYNMAIRNVCERHNIDVLDLYHDINIDKNCLIDRSHPTCDFANNVLAPTIAQFIKDNYKKP